jgi:capsular polysaccharide biosynthesis protein
MHLRFATVDEWLARAAYHFECNLPTFSVKDASERIIEIRPFVVLCHDVAVIGGDWIPVYGDGLALLEQMVHVPTRYFHKAFNISPEGDGYALVQPIEPIDDDVVLIGGHNSYYHWLLDYLPRAITAKKAIGARKLVVNDDPAPYEIESLRTLGYGREQLLLVANHRVIRARSTVVPSLLASTTVPHQAVARLLKTAFPQTKACGYERVYISRADTARRSLSNEPALIALVEKYGFQTIVTGKMSFEEQRNVFYGVKTVVAVHGAGLTNIIFSAPGVDVLEICWADWRPTFFSMLAQFCGHRHQFVAAHVVAVGEERDPMNGTWEADLDALAAALESRFGSASRIQ